MATIPLPPPPSPIPPVHNNNNLTQDNKDESLSNNKVNSDGLSLPLMNEKKGIKHLSRSLSYEKFLSDNNERVVLNVGGKRFETYLSNSNTHHNIIFHDTT
jgi:hypothetical protein